MTADIHTRSEAKETKALRLSDLKPNEEYRNLVKPLPSSQYDSIKDSISKLGVLVPIEVNERYEILDGYHRVQMSVDLRLEYIPARIHSFSSQAEERIFVIRVNYDRRQLNDYQMGELYYQLYQFETGLEAKRRQLAPLVSRDTNDVAVEGEGRTREIIASKSGLSPATYARVVKIIEKGSNEVKDKLRTGKTTINEQYNTIQRHAKREILLLEACKNLRLPDGCKLIHGDFREVSKEIQDDSIDLIFTDPPYAKEFLYLWEALANLAVRVLKPGASLVTISAGYCLPEIIDLFREAGLNYNWFGYMRHAGPTAAVHNNHTFAFGKPILWFYKGARLIDTTKYVADFVESKLPDKSLQEWAQSPVEAEHYIQPLTFENQIVVDAFMGSGTTGIAAVKLNRQFIGIEIDEKRFEVAKARISKYQQEQRAISNTVPAEVPA